MFKIIINADDFGLTEGVSRCIRDLFELEAISNTSVLICVENAKSLLKKYMDNSYSKRVGVHLQLTPESCHKKPLSPAKDIPTLVDSFGNFKPLNHNDWINVKEVKLEWERQIIATGEVLGHSPSHLDSHHGRHRINELTPIYLELASKYNIPVRGGKQKGLFDDFETYGVKSSSMCENEWTGQNKDLKELKSLILKKTKNLDNGILEIVTHPGYCDNDLIESSSWNIVRENDYKVLKELACEKWLISQGIILSDFSKL